MSQTINHYCIVSNTKSGFLVSCLVRDVWNRILLFLAFGFIYICMSLLVTKMILLWLKVPLVHRTGPNVSKVSTLKLGFRQTRFSSTNREKEKEKQCHGRSLTPWDTSHFGPLSCNLFGNLPYTRHKKITGTIWCWDLPWSEDVLSCHNE